MEVLHSRCAGLDVHSRCVNACVRVAAGRKVTTEHREFATTTAGLVDLAAWLSEAGCTHVAMEATGVYWKPVWHILEDEESFTLVLANAQHIRNVPGRKSDRKDAAWIADLLAHFLWGLPGRWIWRSTANIPAGPRSRSPSAPCMPASPTFPPPSSWGRNDDAPTRLGGAQELPARLVLNRGGDYL